jgi:hypothetical protein
MPTPSPASLQGFDALLTQISIGFPQLSYIADSIFPVIGVNKQTGIYAKYNQSHWFRDAAAMRAPGTKSERGGFSVDKGTYHADRFSFGFEIPDELRDSQSAPFDIDRDATRFVTDKLFMKRERSFGSEFFKTGVWGVDKTGVAAAPGANQFIKWSDYANSDPLRDITGWEEEIEGKIGREPNTMVVGRPVWTDLKWHPDVVDSIKYTQRGVVSPDLFASLVDLDRFVIGRAIYTSADEGVAEASVTYSRIFDDDALLLYTPRTPSVLEPAAGYTFVWNRVPNAAQYIKRMRDDEREIDIIESNSYFDQVLTAKQAGIFISDAVD